MSGSAPETLYGWMRPAWWLGRVRAGLRAATVADAIRLRELPPIVGRIGLPALAIGVPLLLSIGHATTHRGFWTPGGATPTAVVIYDVFTESVPFMIVAGLIGLASPAAGVLLTVVYAVGNFAVTVWSDELIPVGAASFGRLVTYLVLWMLVVEIPLLARVVFEWWSSRDHAPRPKRIAALVVTGISVAALTEIWVLGAPLLVVVLFQKTAIWQQPPYVPAGVMVYYGKWIAIALGLGSLAILGVRYLGPAAHVGNLIGERTPSRGPGAAAYIGSMVLTMLLLASVLRKPVDVIVLLAGMLAARPIARQLVQRSQLARPLGAVAWPIRLIAGVAISFGVAWLFLAGVGVSQLSPFFNMVIAIAIGVIVVEIFLAADELAGRRSQAGIGAAIGIGALLVTGLPTVDLADNFGDQPDFGGPAAAAAAAAGAGGAAALHRRPRELKNYSGPPGQESGGPGHGGGPPKPDLGEYGGPGGHEGGGPPKLKEFRPPGAPPSNPPPWWMPDGFGGFFGYD
jgi:hypothetical protein